MVTLPCVSGCSCKKNSNVPLRVNVYLNEVFGAIHALKTGVGWAGVPLRRTRGPRP